MHQLSRSRILSLIFAWHALLSLCLMNSFLQAAKKDASSFLLVSFSPAISVNY